MLLVTPLPAAGEAFLDTRGSGRALRVSWHVDSHPGAHPGGPDGGPAHAPGLVVLSLWHGDTCTGSFRLAAADVPALVDALQDGLARVRPAPRDVRRDRDGRRDRSERTDGLTG